MLEDKGVDTVEMEVVVEVVEEERRHEVKKPKKLKKPKKIKIPHGPFVLDEKKVEKEYKLEPPLGCTGRASHTFGSHVAWFYNPSRATRNHP